MSRERAISRRSMFSLGLGAAVGAVGLRVLGPLAPEACRITPAQTSGPFYPIRDRKDEDSDLTYVRGRDGHAEGEVIFVEGRVTDEACEPVEGAVVEIWQANTHGRYDHEDDPNPAPLDPHFQGWGHAVTDAEGHYRFRTIKPGPYPATETWTRAPHIHFKVARRGFHELTTQMYFEGEALNADDRLLLELSTEERAEVVIPAEEPDEEGEGAGARYTFDISLRPVG